MNLKRFLCNNEIQQLLEDNNLDDVYWEYANLGGDVSELTKFFIRNNIDLLIENIKYIVKEKGITNFAIEDSSFLFNIDFEYFCDKIIEENINNS